MRTRVIVLILFVCVPFSSYIRRLYRILNMAIGFTLHLKDFQITDFAEKASFVSYTNSDSVHGGHFGKTKTQHVDDPLPFT